MASEPAVVIGSGIAGLASAIRLRAQGYDVTILEAAPVPGGKNRDFHRDGFRFDAGPSVFTLPELLKDTLSSAGLDPDEFISIRELEASCRYFWRDGTTLTAWTDPARFAREAEQVLGEPAESIHRFLGRAEKIYNLTEPLFLKKSLHRLSTYLNRDAWRALVNLPAIDTHRTLDQAVRSSIRNPKLQQLFNRYATYNGSDPFQAPATLSVIAHLEHTRGAYFPDGGMISVSRSLVKAAEKLGIPIHLNTRAQEILFQNGTVTGVGTDGQVWPARVVVSNMDIHYTYHHLLPTIDPPNRLLSQPKSSSALIFYWGICGETPSFGLHNIFFSDQYRQEFDDLFQKHQIPADPTVYLYISSKLNRADAPAGHENWFVMINVPNNQGQEWDRMINQIRPVILKTLSQAAGFDVSERLVTESSLDPRSIESQTSSWQGALYGNSSNNRFAAFLRHKNFVSSVRGLYIAGGSVHPGGGVPLCLLSAKIVSDLVKERE